MAQTKRQSWIEITANTVVGFLISVGVQMIIYPMLDLEVSMGENMTITCIFVVIGIIRSYLMRRFFNRIYK